MNTTPIRFVIVTMDSALAGSVARAQVHVAVDPTQDAHVISPLIYGMNFADEALAAHVHPRLSRATTGDLRGHRFELPLSKAKPVTLVLDGALVDAFGQSPSGKGTTFEITYAP